jgi:hypothetical protein
VKLHVSRWRPRKATPPAAAQPVPENRGRRLLAALTAAALSAITGVVSYNHGLDVVRWTGTTGIVAYLVPLVPDLMIVTSSLALIEASAMRITRPPTAMAGLVAGIAWTVAQNVAAGWRNGPGGAVLAAGIPLAFVLTFESLLWLYRSRRQMAAPDSSGQDQAVPLPSTDEALRTLLATDSQRGLADVLGIPKSRVEAWGKKLATVPETASLNGHGGDPS